MPPSIRRSLLVRRTFDVRSDFLCHESMVHVPLVGGLALLTATVDGTSCHEPRGGGPIGRSYDEDFHRAAFVVPREWRAAGR